MLSPEYDSLEDELYHDPHAWRDYAACLDVPLSDDRVIFPWGKNPPTEDETQGWLQEHCDGCPVAQRCLDFAVKTESIGLWGGVELTPSRIARLRRLRIQEGTATVERAKELLGRGKA